jgi:LacI family transcriptional regulator
MSVSVRDVALRAGVSVGTVSNVLNRPERVSEAARDRVLAAIEELGFVRNDAARQLRAGTSRSIGMIVLDAANPFFSDVARGAEDEAALGNHGVLLGNSGEDADRERMYLDLFEEQRLLGVLISPIGDVTDRLHRLRRRGTPAVLVDRISSTGEFSSVSVDDVGGGATAARHLIDQGRRRIAFVGGPLGIRQVADRLQGAESVVAEAPGASLEAIITTGLTVAEGRRIGERLAARDTAHRPDAVFAANDLVAIGLLQALSINGSVRVPEEVALIGFDDIGWAASAVVPISSVRQPAAQIGSAAVRILVGIAPGSAWDWFRSRRGTAVRSRTGRDSRPRRRSPTPASRW